MLLYVRSSDGSSILQECNAFFVDTICSSVCSLLDQTDCKVDSSLVLVKLIVAIDWHYDAYNSMNVLNGIGVQQDGVVEYHISYP